MEGHIAHIQPWPVSLKKYYIHPRVLLHSIAFICIIACFQSSGSLPCEGSFAHTCTNTFVKECHNCCLKWVLKGFLSQGALHPLFSRHVLLFLMKYKSGATRLHFFQNTEYCIHSGTFFDTQTFSKYYCFYWGILCQSNVALSWRNAPPMFKEGITLVNGKLPKKSNARLHYNSFLNLLLYQMNTA